MLRRRRSRAAPSPVAGDYVVPALGHLDDVGWADLEHAYGPAVDVPDLIRSLVKADAEVRKQAIYELYGTIWHQGTVYSSTAHAVPALAAIARTPAIPDRARIIELLAALATGSGYVQVHRWLLESGVDAATDLNAVEAREAQWVGAARAAVVSSAPDLLQLVHDADVEVRRALPYLLGNMHELAARFGAELARAFASDRDEAVRCSLLLGRTALAVRSNDKALMVDALDKARRGPPGERVAAAIAEAALAEADSARTRAVDDFVAAADAGCATLETLAWAGEVDGPVRLMLNVVGARPEERVRLLTGCLAGPSPDLRSTAVFELAETARRWRAITPACVDLLVGIATGDDEQLRGRAVSELRGAFPANRTAADALAANLGHADRTHADAAIALAKLGDSRAKPPLRSALREPAPPLWFGDALKAFGPEVSDLLSEVLAAMPRLANRTKAGAAGPDNRLVRCVNWLGTLGADATPAVPVLVDLLQRGQAVLAVTATMARLGHLARSAEPQLRRLTEEGDPAIQSHAAFALWSALGDLAPLLDVATAVIDTTRRGATITAYLEEVGPAAAGLAPLLELGLVSRDEWVRVRSARAHWRLSEDTATVLPVLLESLAPTPAGALAVEAVGWLGPAADAATQQLTKWLGQDERVSTSGAVGDAIERDEQFQATCRVTLSAIHRPTA
jgi:hypothetical protein